MEEHVEKINRGYFRFNAQTEGEMFQNANELYYQEKKRKKVGSSRDLFGLTGNNASQDQINAEIEEQKRSMKGAIVLSCSKELIN